MVLHSTPSLLFVFPSFCPQLDTFPFLSLLSRAPPALILRPSLRLFGIVMTDAKTFDLPKVLVDTRQTKPGSPRGLALCYRRWAFPSHTLRQRERESQRDRETDSVQRAVDTEIDKERGRQRTESG